MNTRVAYRKSTLALVGLGALLVLSSCGERKVFERTWSEEVELEGGAVVVVKRHVVYDYSNSFSGEFPLNVETTSELEVENSTPELDIPRWSAPMRALLLYRDEATAEWVIVAAIHTCDMWRQKGAPESQYLEFRAHQGIWREGVVSKSSIGRATNLFMGYVDGLARKRVTLQEKKSAWSTFRNGDPAKHIVEKYQNCSNVLPTKKLASRVDRE